MTIQEAINQCKASAHGSANFYNAYHVLRIAFRRAKGYYGKDQEVYNWANNATPMPGLDGGCPWCGRDCPDAGKMDGCWYPNCPDFPHGEY